ALTARTAAKLVVDAAAFVALRADDIEAASAKRLLLLGIHIGFHFRGLAGERFLILDACRLIGEPHVEIAAKLNVGAAACHIGGNGDGAGYTGLRNDMGFLLVIAGVQHLVLHLLLFQK